MLEEVSFRDKLMEEQWHMDGRCHIVLAQIKRKGQIVTLRTLQARFRKRIEGGSELLSIIFSDPRLRTSDILRELERRGFIEVSPERVIRSTRKGREWRRNPFVLDAFRRWREFQLNNAR